MKAEHAMPGTAAPIDSRIASRQALLLLIPGMVCTARVFEGAREWLDPAIEVRVADTLSQSSLDDMARDAWAQVADVPAQRPLLICGFSMGGYVALQMLALQMLALQMQGQPARAVQGLALLCTSARADTEEGLALRERAVLLMGKDFPRFAAGMVSLASTATAKADADLMARMTADMLAVGPEQAIRQQRATAARTDLRPLLAGLHLHARVIGAALDAVVPLDRSTEMASLIPGATLSIIDGVGHMLPWERPAELAAELNALAEAVSADNPENRVNP